MPRILVYLLVSLLTLTLVACGNLGPDGLPSPTTGVSPTPLPTNTPAPSPTTTPEAPLVVLLAPPGADPAVAEDMQELLSELSSQAGLRFQVRPDLSDITSQEEAQLVLVLPPDPGVAQLAASMPEAQFLAVGIPDLAAKDNLSTINAQSQQPDQVAFTAGYLAAAITADWRVGVITEGETPAGKAAQLGFTNGVTYMCGLCRPVFPPFPTRGYPLVAQLTGGASQAEWQPAVDNFQVWEVGTVYVAPQVASEGLYQELAGAGINIIGAEAPAAGLRQNWVVSIGSGDPAQAVRQLWPDLIAGQGGAEVSLPLSLEGVNPDLFSPGRQALVEEMMAELAEGYIDTGVDPATGESRWNE